MKKKSVLIAFVVCLLACISIYYIQKTSFGEDTEHKINRVYDNQKPYIIFNEECFSIKEGDTFDYFGAVKETNGEIDSINSIHIDYKKGSYAITYVVRKSNDVNEYSKTLTVK